MARFPSKSSMFRFMREAGVEIGTVLDVGAQEDTAELRLAFPDKRHILFEPAVEFHAALKRNYGALDHVLVPAALSDSDGQGMLRKASIDGGAVSHSSLVDSADGGPIEPVAQMRLDTFMKGQDCPKPYLLKVDVDGYELPILRGAEGIWNDIACIIVEAPVDTFFERTSFIMARAFRVFDIVDHCYYHDMLSQVDMVFVAERVMQNPNLRPWQTKPFAWSHWEPVAGLESRIKERPAASAKPARGIAHLIAKARSFAGR
ncbi:FkbM family methyltransferase [Reyranella sp. CPCC 100927]|uniref:FkbM family methyltransferase n=1 Tax=Reyranella sp. CPCC 100927 TaxID=2599616 RepID=UPI0011B4794E|nr:FkbM family methyltransferase [Reyranella sp. CPCC 100927]TWT12892.1 FkbM family methyltransferase [Reyranella sp. CPCC 100927]